MSWIGAIRLVGGGVVAVLQAGDAVITAIKGLRKMPRPKPVNELRGKDVIHIDEQIKAGARPFPPPRKR